MKITYMDKTGEHTKTLTQEEIVKHASLGDLKAKKELYKQAKKETIEERLTALEELIK